MKVRVAFFFFKNNTKEKAQEAVDAENDDMNLTADMLIEAADLIEDAADLLVQAASLLKGEEIEADCCFPYCVVEVFCDDVL